MNENKQKESLTRALAYLTHLHDQFVEEIDFKTVEIKRHLAGKDRMVCHDGDTLSGKNSLREWRRKSFALHQRRSRLKNMKDTLSRQIEEVQRALSRVRNVQDVPALNHGIRLRPAEPCGVESLSA